MILSVLLLNHKIHVVVLADDFRLFAQAIVVVLLAANLRRVESLLGILDHFWQPVLQLSLEVTSCFIP